MGCTLKVAKYLQLIEGAQMISRVFSSAAADLCFALILFILIYYGFTNVAQQIFGAAVGEFKDTLTTWTELLCIVLGKLSHTDELFTVAPFGGPLFLVAFLFVMVFTLNNLFLAIICDSFTRNRGQRDEERWQKKIAQEAQVTAFGLRDARTLRDRLMNALQLAQNKSHALLRDRIEPRLRVAGWRRTNSRGRGLTNADLTGVRMSTADSRLDQDESTVDG